jgi:orotate phosphoribosyltransferase
MTQEQVLQIFKDNKAFLEGHFVLSSGLHSPNYMQCAKVLQNPVATELLCKELADKFKEFNPTVVVAPALGGVIVAYETARALGVPGIFTERKDGQMLLRRGFELTEEDRVLIVEDIITTGKSTKEVMAVVSQNNSKIIGIGCIGDRTEGKVDFGVPFNALAKVSIPVFSSEECPLCKEGKEAVKPGSRIKQ